MVKVIVDTLEKVDNQRGENKFYRVYRIPELDLAFCQNGSQRNGRTGGTFRAWTHDEGLDKLHEKQRTGYTGVIGDTSDFQVDEKKLASLQTDKHKGALLENIHSAKRHASPAPVDLTERPKPGSPSPAQPSPAQPTPASTSVATTGQLGVILLSAIEKAATDPNSALVDYASAKEAFEAVKLDYEKCRSYLDTLEILVDEVL